LPLVVTPNAGGEDLVVEGRTGFLVGVGDVRGLADRIGWFADHREALPAMGVACREMAAARGWERFAGDVAGRMR
jgi:glycosyltransferase involved in cell wall biosynthesis